MNTSPCHKWIFGVIIITIVCIMNSNGFTNGEFDYQAGICKGDCKNGKGKMTYSDTGTYDGQWKGGIWHGKGTRIWADGGKFTGKYEHGDRIQGTLTELNGLKYEGQFYKNKRHGFGTITWPDGMKYTGEWKDNRITGKGEFYHPEHGKLTGQFREEGVDGPADFYATVTWHKADGNKYVGEVVWCTGMMFFFKKKKGTLYDNAGKMINEVNNDCSCSGAMGH